MVDSDFTFVQLFIELTDKEDRHIISEKFAFGPVSTIGMRVICP